jgi:uncharacterized protein (DUF1015 family)
VPYDVVYDGEVRDFIDNNPDSFLRVTRAEGDFEPSEKPGEADIFARARENLESLVSRGIYFEDPEEAIYVYRLSGNGHKQTGVVACCSIDEYEAGKIKKHENVRPDKVEDRTRHLLAVGAQTGLIFLAFKGITEIGDLMKAAVLEQPIYDFDGEDGIHQSVWRVTRTKAWVRAFAQVPALYIADGHHRLESALRARDTMRAANADHTGQEDYNFVVAGIFPARHLQILPYNRVVKGLNGLDREEMFARIRKNFILVDTIEKAPSHHGEFCMYLDRAWYKLRFSAEKMRSLDPIAGLDVSILQDYILRPVLGIEDPTTDERIGFVGGNRGPEELENLVDSGSANIAFSLFPTRMEDLLTVSDMGEIMPPKSTWFEPKLKDGLLVHMI